VRFSASQSAWANRLFPFPVFHSERQKEIDPSRPSRPATPGHSERQRKIPLHSALRCARFLLFPLLFAYVSIAAAGPCLAQTEKDAAPPGPSTEERYLFDAVNRERAETHLPALRWDAALAEAARLHAERMARQHRFAHQLPGEPSLSQRAGQAGAHFSRIAENIAIGAESEEIHDGWMQSPGHRANILNAGFTSLGVGTFKSQGRLYAVEDFSASVDLVPLKAQEDEVAELLVRRGLRVARDRDMARQLCLDRSAGPTRRPMVILRYESADLSELPELVTKNIREHQFGQAEVGACTPKEDGSGFTRFRIAVVLF
jgi:uncharacterized protein YkwD